MNNINYQETLLEFLDIICPNEHMDIYDFISVVESNIEDIAEKLSIGKYWIKFIKPLSIYNNYNKEENIELYNSGKVGSDTVTREYVIGSTGLVVHHINCRMNRAWTEGEKDEIVLFSKLMQSYFDLARLKDTVFKATTHDSMTGAMITRELFRRGSLLTMKGQLVHYDAVFLNIKNLKYINQVVGSRYGDEYIVKMCKNVFNFLKDDEIFARLGGDNFVAVIFKERMDDFIKLFNKMVIQVDFGDNPYEFPVLVRMGLKKIDQNDDMNTVINGAAAALSYARKIGTSDIVWFNDRMLEGDLFKRKFAKDFPKLILDNKVEVVYQPVIDITDNSIRSVEALSRIEFDGETIYPDKFLPVLEVNDIVSRLDFYVLDKVCKDINFWRHEGLEPPIISVNFSHRHLTDVYFVDRVIDVVEKYGVNPGWVEIEMSEANLEEDYAVMHNSYIRLMEYGFNVAVDNFGKGHSSLTLIGKAESTMVKLDRVFALEIDKPNTQIILKWLVGLLTELGKEVVIEGVETDREVMFLKKIGCKLIQGFVFDKPLSMLEIRERFINPQWYNEIRL
ncbi:MAG: bifunctional diguanylate cyclase/phosphodiesterase [Lachnospiraceae bacterium]|nr:bifunctional diguanylate cyclase/phosphodiesterase [Lachnospiraceae bacterium]